MNSIFKICIVSIATIFLTNCARELSDCSGYEVDKENLLGIRETFFSDGPQASLIVPNPLDAASRLNPQSTQLSQGLLESLVEDFSLPDLLSPSRLETAFLKIRLRNTSDAASTFSSYDYPITDPRYSEVMAYHSMSAMIRYVEALGFSLVKTRPFYVMVRAQAPAGEENAVNAIYSHNYFDQSMPRTLHLFGDTNYAPGMDRDIYWHEFGHFLNESVSREAGIDFAGDSGAIFTEGSALHECLADYLSESVGNKGYIGRWIARNFPQVPAGAPLRWATKQADEFNEFRNVSQFTGDGVNLDRYRMAQWCSRVLWDLREQFTKEDSATGAIFADRLVFSAVSKLKRDTSMAQFKQALSSADESLHCGLHSRSIEKAFAARGFGSGQNLGAPLQLEAAPRSVNSSTSSRQLTFAVAIKNPNSQTARNVRLYLESPDGKLFPTVYMQGFGDLPPGGSIQIGTQNGLDLGYSVMGTANSTFVGYRLRVRAENGVDTVVEGRSGL